MSQHPPYGHPGPHGRPNIHVDAREVRPGRGWFVIGALVIAGGIATAIVGFVLSLVSTVSIPEFEARVTSGQESSFTVADPGFQLGLYSSSGGGGRACVLLLPDGGEAGFDNPGYSHNVDTGAESWSLVGTYELSEAGEYTLSCSDGSTTTEFAVTDNGDGGAEIVRGVGSTLLWALVPSFLGLVIGLTIIITTAVRRGRFQRRLIAERQQWYYGHGPR
ncbi:hypothetical protein [Nocardiopsis listeri]|uniref:hypothetical protein n=1 Tax=Nocardiopsis listeri TaxID=53440 RepID=UPI00082A35CA|nr:hypothetical protein [Nocardiopsis listeri]